MQSGDGNLLKMLDNSQVFALLCETPTFLLTHDGVLPKEDIEAIFAYNSSIKIADLHIWQIAPNAHACEIIVYNNSKQGADFCRDKI